MLAGYAALLLHLPLMAGGAILLAGIIPTARARLAGLAGPSIVHPWHRWRRLLRKRPVMREGAAPLMEWAPVVAFIATGLAALLVPSFTLGMATAPLADLLVVLGLLGLARVAMVLGAIDAATGPSGLVAMRAARLGAVAEPALVLVVFTIVLLTGTTNLDMAATALHDSLLPGVSMVLALAGLVSVAIAVDAEGDTVHDSYSGWYAAAAEAMVALRRVVWLSLIAALLLPGGIALAGSGPAEWLLGMLVWLVKLAVLSTICAVAVPSLRRAGEAGIGPLLGTASLLGVLAALFLFAAQGLT